jgi:hypothetical protein
MLKEDSTKLKNIQDILKYTFGIVFIAMGVDNYLNIIASWPNYLNPSIAAFFNTDAKSFMYYVGILEMFAGALVLMAPKTGGYFISIGLLAVSINLITQNKYYDLALFNVVMAVGSYALALLSDLIQLQIQVPVKEKSAVEELQLVE